MTPAQAAIDRTETAGRSGGPTVAVAFGGGGARGISHIHIIETLDELGISPVAITGSSIGAIMGSGMASGLSGAEIRDHTLATIGRRRAAFGRIWQARPATMRDMVDGGFRLGQFNAERIVDAFLPEKVARTFDELVIPAGIMVTDYYGHREIEVREGDLRCAVAASAAIPAVFGPVRIDGRLMIDGGIFNPVPFDRLQGKADVIIGIDVVGLPSGTAGDTPSTVDMMFGANQLMMQSIIGMKRKACPPDVFLRPAVHQFRVLDFLKAREILEASKGIREELKRELDAAMTRAAKA